MASTFKTPGVYVEEIRKFPPSIAQVQTAIPAFIGHTEKAIKGGESLVEFDEGAGAFTKLKPIRITSLLEYREHFGGAQKEQNILVTINEEQNSEGKTLSIEANGSFSDVRSRHNMYHAVEAYFDNGGGPCYIFSVGPYDDENFGSPINSALLIAALEYVAKEDEPTLLVFPEAQGVAVNTDVRSVYDAALTQCAELQDRFVIMDVYDQGNNINDAAKDFRDNVVSNDNLKYGAAYYPNLEMVYDYPFDPANVGVEHNITTEGTTASTTTTMGALNSAQRSLVENAIFQMPMILPPSPVMAGIYAAVDSSQGVWKAPANVSVKFIIKPTVKISDKAQEDLNVDADNGKSINAIRSFAGKGTLVWGARTLAGNDNEWRYISVRRFFNMVEESAKKASAQFVFEPNDANTWIKVKAMIENFLVLQWRAGALAGATPEEAFFVSVGLNETMTAIDILEGRMIVEIGMAVVRPAEFIILKFSHKMQES